jgi:hypothetical protein
MARSHPRRSVNQGPRPGRAGQHIHIHCTVCASAQSPLTSFGIPGADTSQRVIHTAGCRPFLVPGPRSPRRPRGAICPARGCQGAWWDWQALDCARTERSTGRPRPDPGSNRRAPHSRPSPTVGVDGDECVGLQTGHGQVLRVAKLAPLVLPRDLPCRATRLSLT